MIANTKYERVLPRDLFNEAKLLKCIGHLILKIHDNMAPIPMSHQENGEPFKIGLLDEGSLTITNLHIAVKKKLFLFKTTYNSKANFPLFLEYEYCDYRVFDEAGDFDEEFINFCKTVK